MNVTLKEVAELAGVSRSAVSRTFTRGALVSAETREKVEQAAHKLGYSPNALASSLTTGRRCCANWRAIRPRRISAAMTCCPSVRFRHCVTVVCGPEGYRRDRVE